MSPLLQLRRQYLNFYKQRRKTKRIGIDESCSFSKCAGQLRASVNSLILCYHSTLSYQTYIYNRRQRWCSSENTIRIPMRIQNNNTTQTQTIQAATIYLKVSQHEISFKQLSKTHLNQSVIYCLKSKKRNYFLKCRPESEGSLRGDAVYAKSLCTFCFDAE